MILGFQLLLLLPAMTLKEFLRVHLFLSFFSFMILSQHCNAIENANITQTRFIRDGETITSPDGSFKLGFFSPGNSTKRYIGIWFAKITVQTVVWVANREAPLPDFSGIFKMGNEGNLVLLDGKQNILWSSNYSVVSNNSIGRLQDSGNLIICNKNSDKVEDILWQSFDHPTDTFLAGMKFGMNLKTGENQLLTSWKNPNDPAPGEFSLGFDPTRVVQLIQWNSSRKYWRSGQWNGQSLTGVPEMTAFHLYGFNIINEGNEGRLYCTYSDVNNSVVSSFLLSSNGKLERSYWNEKALGWDTVWSQPNSECQLYQRCGPHGVCNHKSTPICSCLPGFSPSEPDDWYSGKWSAGCIRDTPLECKEKNLYKKDGFLRLTGMKLPDNSQSVPALETTKDCEGRCKSNCSCVAYAYEYGLGCLTWDGELKDIQTFPNDGQDLYIRLDKSDLRGKKKDTPGWLFALIMLAIIPVVLYACLTVRKIRTAQRTSSNIEDSQKLQFSDLGMQKNSNRYFLDANELEKIVYKGKGPDLPTYALDMIRGATDNFSAANKLGEGGFGPVYKGKIPTGQIIAVKRLSHGSGQGMLEFENEVILIAKLQHRNLVRLLGCCIQGGEKMLIYEYMPNKSLDAFIFDRTKRQELDWETRFDIIEGIARGLLYLHRDSRLRIIHRDMKASNILLDEQMNPKISDFGMARIFGGNQNQENTMRVVGTYGYMAPEYAMEGLFSTKSDVFSFGVLLLEILSGKRNSGFIHTNQSLNLLGYAWERWSENSILDLTDPSIDISLSTEEVSRCIQVGLLCVQDNPSDRPSMDAVVFMLGSEAAIIPTPKKPGFSTGRTPRESDAYLLSAELNCSTNGLTISMEHGR